MKNKGVILLAFGNPGYIYAAANLAFSIKHHNKDVDITLFADDHIHYIGEDQKALFDDIQPLSHEDTHRNGQLDPGYVKVSIYDRLPYKHNLYLDVDALCLADLMPTIDDLIKDGRPYIATVVDSGDHNNENINYSVWAKTSDIVSYFKIPKKNKVIAIQSSWAFIRRSTEAREYLAKVKRAFTHGMERHKLKELWGGTHPDELYFSGVAAMMGMDVAAKTQPLYFGDQSPRLGHDEIIEKHSVLSLYGNGNGKTKTPIMYYEMYDSYLRKYSIQSDIKFRHHKSDLIRKSKHANKR